MTAISSKQNPQEKIELNNTVLTIEEDPPKVLDIGSGSHPVAGHADTLDRMEKFNPDILHDLTNLPLPIEDNQYDLVVLKDVLEHLTTNPVYLDKLFSELERILSENGEVYLRVPHYNSPNAAGDLQHSRTGYSAAEFNLDYIETDLKLSRKRLTFSKRKKLPWNYLLQPVANLNVWFWEWMPFTDIFPTENIEVVMKK